MFCAAALRPMAGSEGAEDLVSVVIAVHNAGGTIDAAIASVAAQTYRPIEVGQVGGSSRFGLARTSHTPRFANDVARRLAGGGCR